MFKSKASLICSLTVFFGLPSVSTFAQPQPVIQILATFDYPGAGNSTTAIGINDRDDIVGFYVDSGGVTRGFVRASNGTFSLPIVEPRDTGNFTRCEGINNSGTVSGDFFNVAENAFHGYFLSGGTFTQFDVGPSFSTSLVGINVAGNFVGTFGNVAQPNRAFINIGGTTVVIAIPGAYDSYGNGINTQNEVVGSYSDSSLVYHGFFRAAGGTLKFPIDFPGSASTLLGGMNDRNAIVGSYTDNSGGVHGLLLHKPNTFVSFDYPGAVATSFNGINNAGHISGRYTDGAGVRHGFLAAVITPPAD